MTRCGIAGALALLLSVAMPAAAQQTLEDPHEKADNGGVADDCRVEPRIDQQAGAGDPATGGAADSGDKSDEPLSGTLERCKGVLAPPPSGDAEMTAPAPDAGKTPVIRPDEVPEQPPKN